MVRVRAVAQLQVVMLDGISQALDLVDALGRDLHRLDVLGTALVATRGRLMPSLNVPQASFLRMDTKFRGFVAGFGSGKTWVGCAALCKHVWEWPRINSGYFAPTYPQIRDIFFPTIEEVAFDWGLKVKTKESDKEVEFYSGGQYRSTTICRSMEKPQTIVGFKIGHALVDELDVLPALKAEHAWRKIIARMRYNEQGLKNGVEPLYIGMDFNVGKMAAITHVKRADGRPRAVDELIDGFDTPDMIRRIKERYRGRLFDC